MGAFSFALIRISKNKEAEIHRDLHAPDKKHKVMRVDLPTGRQVRITALE
jgi:hypothetical protein